MEETKYKAGDLVQLKSGGPLMTVSEQVMNLVHVTWWNGGTSDFSRESFYADCLEAADPVEKPSKF